MALHRAHLSVPEVGYNGVVAVVPVSLISIDALIAEHNVVVLDFWAAWCRPCSQFSPVFESVSERIDGALFASVNTDAEQDLAKRFLVQSLPTVVILIAGQPVFRRAGVMTSRELERVVREFLALV